MPESNFKTKVVKDSWEFGDLLNHIAYGIEWWNSNVIKKIETEWTSPKTPSNKKELLKYIGEAYDTFKETLEKSKMTDDVIFGFNATIDHITHHRGQAILFLRSNNITPPEYIY